MNPASNVMILSANNIFSISLSSVRARTICPAKYKTLVFYMFLVGLFLFFKKVNLCYWFFYDVLHKNTCSINIYVMVNVKKSNSNSTAESHTKT